MIITMELDTELVDYLRSRHSGGRVTEELADQSLSGYADKNYQTITARLALAVYAAEVDS